MDVSVLVESIKADRTKHNINLLIDEVLRTGLDWDDFFDVFHATEYPLKWHLSWWFGHYIKLHQSLGYHIQNRIWKELSIYKHPSIQRDLWRTFSYISLNDEMTGVLFDAALKKIPSQLYSVAERAYAMEVAMNVCKQIPELSFELILVLEGLEEEESIGIRARARNFLKPLKKMIP